MTEFPEDIERANAQRINEVPKKPTLKSLQAEVDELRESLSKLWRETSNARLSHMMFR